MKAHPAPFNRSMVTALIFDLKTQTRRSIKPQPSADAVDLYCGNIIAHDMECSETGGHLGFGFQDEQRLWRCPYGKPGDQIYVKETFYAFGHWTTRYNAKKGRDEWHFVDLTLTAGKAYLFDEPCGFHQDTRMRCGATPKWHRRPAIFMPRATSRITLEVTAVRVERLRDISEQDCIAEGAPGGHGSIPGYPYHATPHEHYRHVWEFINGAGDWAADPFVWVITFKRLISEVAASPQINPALMQQHF